MDRLRPSHSLAVAAALALLSTASAVAQTEGPGVDEGSIQVSGVEYAFVGLPTSVPAGTSLSLMNAGTEVHQLDIARFRDDVTASIEELLASEENPFAAGLLEPIGQPLVAAPGSAAPFTMPILRDGRYVAMCTIPQGLTDVSVLERMFGPTSDPASLTAEEISIFSNPRHRDLGMVQEFTVTAPGTSPGPLPASTDESATESAGPAS